jgi:hypothetical protein
LRHLCLISLLLPGLLSAQAPRIGIIDFYGAGKASRAQALKIIKAKEGDPLPASKGDVEEKLEAISGVVRAQLTAACCEAGKAILYVGLEEKGAPHFDYRQPPNGTAVLPEKIARAYTDFIGAVSQSSAKADLSEDLTHGHSLMGDAGIRSIQEMFLPLAEQYTPELKAVLREGADDEQRAMAAYVIGYSPNKPQIVDDLVYALHDPDDTVRGNALRSLAALAVLSRVDPKSGVKVPPTWIVEMLNSVIWTDRHNAAVTLVTLTEGRDPETLDIIRERATDSLADMASWKHLPHALPAYVLLGRVAGMSEQDLQKTWAAGQRQILIDKFRKK